MPTGLWYDARAAREAHALQAYQRQFRARGKDAETAKRLARIKALRGGKGFR